MCKTARGPSEPSLSAQLEVAVLLVQVLPRSKHSEYRACPSSRVQSIRHMRRDKCSAFRDKHWHASYTSMYAPRSVVGHFPQPLSPCWSPVSISPLALAVSCTGRSGRAWHTETLGGNPDLNV